MRTNQQNETLLYFDKFANEWMHKSQNTSTNEVNVIQQRNQFVIDTILSREKTKATLDVGCGTGELTIDIAKMGINAIGLDFAPEMIKIAEETAKRANATLATFSCASIFNFESPNDQFDLISANGFIEYISHSELVQFLKKSHDWLKVGGSLVLGSRNRLFNLFSLNKFTQDEINQGNINELFNEAITFQNINHVSELMKIKPADLLEVNHQQKTGIDVSVRHQYTPTQIINIALEAEFKPEEIAPIHIHGLTPRCKDNYPLIHAKISNLLLSCKNDSLAFVPMSSSFMVHLKKG